ncbi:MAG: glycosyltransferase, partial [Dehalococcoidia bacterium]
MKDHKVHLSIVIPTYNENANIQPLVERIHQSLGDYPYDILIVDDNSPDGTADKVRQLALSYPVNV